MKRRALLTVACCALLRGSVALAQPEPPASQPASSPASQPVPPDDPEQSPAERQPLPIAEKPPEEPKPPPAPVVKKKAEKNPASKALSWLGGRIRLGALWYLHYGGGKKAGDAFNRFHIGRGYTTIKFRPAKWFEARSTLDVHQDGDGNWSARLKYLYGRFKAPVESRVVSAPYLEVGIAHIPWLHYEEEINRYRMQGTMFLERNGLFNSADLGVTVGALIGRKLSAADSARAGGHHPGEWGSVALGVYNGGGYHGAEENTGKVFMGRLSARPLGAFFPHLQLSYFLIYGQGNNESAPAWQVHDFFLSFEHPYVVLTGQLGLGRGTQKGDRVEADNTAQPFLGASGFGELRLPWIDMSLFGRYDWFRWETVGGDLISSRVIVGAAWWFFGKCALLGDLDYVAYIDQSEPDDWQLKLTLQIKL